MSNIKSTLIAAAPEMYAALAELAHQVEISGAIDDHGHPIKNLRALTVAREALAKAEGRAPEMFTPAEVEALDNIDPDCLPGA